MEDDSEDGPIETFVKGISMGLADIIPGVSGGTIALIVGIYERLIFALESIDLGFIPPLIRAIFDKEYFDEAKRKFSSIDFEFLLPLGAGIGLAFLIASRVILFARENYLAYISSFFFGLILASAVFVYKRVEEPDLISLLFGLASFVFAAWFTGLEGVLNQHSIPIIFFAGYLAICAMLLPGISGSFMVLVLGQYEYMLATLKSFRVYWVQIAIFGVGAVLSLLTFPRIISRLLDNYRKRTLLFLSGLMLGALRLPLENISGEISLVEPSIPLLGAVISGVVGVILVYLTTRLE